MEKKENIFSKLLNKIKAFSEKYLEQDIKNPVDELETQYEIEEYKRALKVEEEIEKNKNSDSEHTVEQVIIDENAARNAAEAKADRNNKGKNSELQK